MEQFNETEWQTDPKTGRRYKRVGNCIEYEMEIHTNGAVVPASQLDEYNRRNREAAERQRKEAAAAMRQEPHKSCPFKDGLSTSCKSDCAFYRAEDGCRLAAHPGTPTEGKKCPFNNKVCNGTCAMYKNGCTLPAL